MTKLIYWPPLPHLESLSNQLDRVFNEVYKTPEKPQAWTPKIEVQNAETALILRVEVPGVEAKYLDVQVSRQSVLIAGEYRQKAMENAGRSRSEFRYGQFRRVVDLPVAVQNQQLTAALKDGILTLTLPKASAVRPKVVKVNVAEVETNRQNPAPTDKGEPVAIADPQLLEDVWGVSEAA